MTRRLGHLRALLCLLALKGTWHWQLQDVQEGLVWVLVHEGGDTPALVYALGETLSPQARAIACLHPEVMKELAATEEKSQEALERLQRLDWMLARLQRRIYKAGQREHYRDLRWAQVELGVVTRLLQADAMPTLRRCRRGKKVCSILTNCPRVSRRRPGVRGVPVGVALRVRGGQRALHARQDFFALAKHANGSPLSDAQLPFRRHGGPQAGRNAPRLRLGCADLAAVLCRWHKGKACTHSSGFWHGLCRFFVWLWFGFSSRNFWRLWLACLCLGSPTALNLMLLEVPEKRP